MRLVVRVRRRKFGSRLLLKLAAIFALVGVVPGVLIYTVSYQFVSRSIESWFDVKVEGALDAGLNLGRGTLDALVNDLADQDPRWPPSAWATSRRADAAARPLALERLREQLAAQEVAIVGAAGQTLLVGQQQHGRADARAADRRACCARRAAAARGQPARRAWTTTPAARRARARARAGADAQRELRARPSRSAS